MFIHIFYVFLWCSNVWNHFPFYSGEDVLVSKYLVSISSSGGAQFILCLVKGEKYNGKNREFGFGLHCFWHAGRAPKNPLCESNPCCELQRIKNFTHRERKKRTNSEKNKHSPFFHMLKLLQANMGNQPVACCPHCTTTDAHSCNALQEP